MSRTSNNCFTTGKTSIVSGVLTETRKFSWKIENFNVIRKSEQLVKSQTFSFEAGGQIGLPTKWICYLRPDDEVSSGERDINFFCRMLENPTNATEVNASFSVEVLRCTGDVERCFKRNVKLQNMAGADAKNGWGFPHWLTGVVPLVDNCLLIESEFKLFAPKTGNVLKVDLAAKMAEFEAKSIAQIRNDYGRMQNMSIANDGSNSNAIIISNDKVEFPVLRVILQARSHVFERMFLSKMQESQTGMVQLDDLSSKTVQVLLHYIYTGALHENWKSGDVILELTYAAQKYELQVLIDFLDDALACVCTLENAGKLAVLAKKLSMKKAEEALFNFIKNEATSIDDIMIVDVD